MKKKKLTLAGVMLGAALTTTSAFAGNSGACGAGKCGGSMNDNMQEMHKNKKTDSCGSGKCGSSMMNKGSCGAGKCGGSMKSDMKNDMHNMNKNMQKK